MVFDCYLPCRFLDCLFGVYVFYCFCSVAVFCRFLGCGLGNYGCGCLQWFVYHMMGFFWDSHFKLVLLSGFGVFIVFCYVVG